MQKNFKATIERWILRLIILSNMLSFFFIIHFRMWQRIC